jgi:hypothetical protein
MTISFWSSDALPYQTEISDRRPSKVILGLYVTGTGDGTREKPLLLESHAEAREWVLTPIFERAAEHLREPLKELAGWRDEVATARKDLAELTKEIRAAD